MGQVGIRPDDFWELTFAEVILSILGFTELKTAEQESTWKQTEHIRNEMWIAIRWQTAALMTSMGSKAVDPKQLLKLPGDEAESQDVVIENPMTNEELEECANAWNINLEKYERR